MKKEITQHVALCQICQRNKYQALSSAGLLQPPPIPNIAWEEIIMDFIVGFPRSVGFDALMVVVDRLSKVWAFHFDKVVMIFVNIGSFQSSSILDKSPATLFKALNLLTMSNS